MYLKEDKATTEGVVSPEGRKVLDKLVFELCFPIWDSRTFTRLPPDLQERYAKFHRAIYGYYPSSYSCSEKSKGLKIRGKKKYTPPCIQSLLGGVKQGERDEAAFTLGCFFLQYDDAETVREVLEDWNLRNNPELEREKLLEALRQANKRELGGSLAYKLGCSNITLQRHCKGKCRWGKKVRRLRFDICQLQAGLDGSQKCAVSWKLCPKKRRQGKLTRGCYGRI